MEKKTIPLLEIDPYLKPFSKDITLRQTRYVNGKAKLLESKKNLSEFANGHNYYGIHRTKTGWIYREWAPGAEALWLIGDFNSWNGESHPLERKENGNWEIYIDGRDTLQHLQRVKVRIKTGRQLRDRIPVYIKRTIQSLDTHDFSGQIWEPESPFCWTDKNFRVKEEEPRFIYEAHVGMAQEKEAIGTFLEFKETVLPRIKAGGYNTVQLMAVMSHPYYASFGYQVANFFGVSHWFGTPDDLKALIDEAHSLGIAVLLDLVHSHSVKNIEDGINEFDGTDYQYFHAKEKGNHPAWDSKLFNYGKPEVVHFLLSNIKFWLEEYHFDGFRFDGVTSMLYHHKGLGIDFDGYKKYFSAETDLDAVTYLQLANELTKEIRPDGITIAEDMSGMPGMGIPIVDGGIGFDYRLSMGVPDLWIKILKLPRDEDWSMLQLWHELTGRRPLEKNIGYAESHDQALVGDKTIMFRLADKEMYWHMDKQDNNPVIARAMALHKLIRFITISLGGEGYLNFMGNEFGHPEWIDFPRAGNNWSYLHARRQWSLVDNGFLKFEYLNNFDKAMLAFIKKAEILRANPPHNLWIDEENKTIAFKKNEYVFLLNFNPSKSVEGYPIPTDIQGEYRVIFDSDEKDFGGQERISKNTIYKTRKLPTRMNRDGVVIYSPSRTALVLELVEKTV